MRDDKERTIITVMKEGEMEYERIIPNNDKAFKISHRSIHNKNQIILFVTPGASSLFKMFIYKKGVGILHSVEYNNMEETWSVFNGLSLRNKLYND